MKTLIPLLGDQMDPASAVLRAAVPGRDVIVMAEVPAEIRRHPNHKQRVALFLSAMRHLRDALRARGFTVDYHQVTDPDDVPDLPAALAQAIQRHRPDRIRLLRPGRFDEIAALESTAHEAGVPLEHVEDDHFFCTPDDFRAWADGRKVFVMEHFYRFMRRREGVLMDGDAPAGGRWNYDQENRKALDGPPAFPAPCSFPPDALTREVLADVERLFPDLPGTTDGFDWPVTPRNAARAADDFLQHRLPTFGDYQDAMWTGAPWLSHSRLSPALNLHLLRPHVLVEGAEEAYRSGTAPLNAVEGFIRQILGWREYVRGLYWLTMPEYATRNALDADRPLPAFYWTGETEMACLRDVIRQLLAHGYAHHIQRLMVAGLFTLLLGVRPREVHDWFMALYLDAVEWVTLPNVLGMSQYADGGLLATKPYIASGQYIDRMSNYCRGCRYDPARATGPDACPFTTLYWAFLDRHRSRLDGNRRLTFQMKNWDRKPEAEQAAIRARAEQLIERFS